MTAPLIAECWRCHWADPHPPHGHTIDADRYTSSVAPGGVNVGTDRVPVPAQCPGWPR